MAFEAHKFTTLGAQAKAGIAYQRFGYLADSDTVETISADGYFNITKETLSRYDVIEVLDRLSTPNRIITLLVTAKPLGGNVQTEEIETGGTGMDFLLKVMQGKIDGYSIMDKFGENPLIDVNTVPEDIWEGGGEYTWSDDGVADIDTLSSSNVSDVGQLISVGGLLIDGTLQTGYAQLNGQNKVLIYDNSSLTGDPISFWRVFRMANESDAGNDLAGTVYCYVDTAISAGNPIDTTKIRAVIENGNNQTLMALYTVPKGKVGYLYRGEIGMSRAQSTGAIEGAYYSRRYGKLFKIKKRVDIVNSGSSNYQDARSFPDIIPALTDIKLTVKAVSANSSSVFGTFDILLVDEDKLSEEYLASIGQAGY